MQRIAIKYCGGCNPDYDRVVLVKRIKENLNDLVEFVSLDDRDIDLVLAIEGCQTACAEISDHQQSWGYEAGPSKGPGIGSAGGR
jgi:hypothetical protein